VVTSTRSGAAELVTEHAAGFVCDARDEAALAAHMRTLQDAGTREPLAANARRAVEALTPAAMTLKLVLLYKELLEASVAHRMAARAAASRERQAVVEAPPLHGDDGLDSETLPRGVPPDRSLPPGTPPR
jgi:hypothetical protein